MTDLKTFGSRLELECQGSLCEIREALEHVAVYLRARRIKREWIEDLNLVLAEALSNIARHGYRDGSGWIKLELDLGETSLDCEITDLGAKFDPSILGRSTPSPTELAEGGYGWFIIRSLTRTLKYLHEDGRNILRFSIPVAVSGEAG